MNANLAPIITISYGGCETDLPAAFYRSIAQQANAQGITMLASSGDSGAAGCDRQGSADRDARPQRRISDCAARRSRPSAARSSSKAAAPTGRPPTRRTSARRFPIFRRRPGTRPAAINGLLAGGGGVSRFIPQPVVAARARRARRTACGTIPTSR